MRSLFSLFLISCYIIALSVATVLCIIVVLFAPVSAEAFIVGGAFIVFAYRFLFGPLFALQLRLEISDTQ